MCVSALVTVAVAARIISKHQCCNVTHFLISWVHSGQTKVKNYLICIFLLSTFCLFLESFNKLVSAYLSLSVANQLSSLCCLLSSSSCSCQNYLLNKCSFFPQDQSLLVGYSFFGFLRSGKNKFCSKTASSDTIYTSVALEQISRVFSFCLGLLQASRYFTPLLYSSLVRKQMLPEFMWHSGFKYCTASC